MFLPCPSSEEVRAPYPAILPPFYPHNTDLFRPWELSSSTLVSLRMGNPQGSPRLWHGGCGQTSKVREWLPRGGEREKGKIWGNLSAFGITFGLEAKKGRKLPQKHSQIAWESNGGKPRWALKGERKSMKNQKETMSSTHSENTGEVEHEKFPDGETQCEQGITPCIKVLCESSFKLHWE